MNTTNSTDRTTTTLISDFMIGNDRSIYERDFLPHNAIGTFHGAPRLGHGHDFSLLYSSNPDEVKDYKRGFVFTALCVIIFFATWGACLLRFKCLGQHRMGFLSGHAYQKQDKSARTGRLVFVISSVLVIVFTILLASKGLSELDATAHTLDATNLDILDIHGEFVGISNDIKISALLSIPLRNRIVSSLKKDACPLIPGLQHVPDVLQIPGSSLEAMESLSYLIVDHFRKMDADFEQVIGETYGIDAIVESVESSSKALSIIVILCYFATALMIFNLVLGWLGIYRNKRYYSLVFYVLLPVFVLVVIFASVGAASAVLAIEGTADFCSGGATGTPEGTIQRILWQKNMFEGFGPDTVAFYTSQCRTEGPWDFLERYYGALLETKFILGRLEHAIANDGVLEDMPVGCFIYLDSHTLDDYDRLTTHITNLIRLVEASMDLLSCRRIVPLYTSIVYDASCDYSITAVTWTFACLLLIAFFGMTMITFRAACCPIGYCHRESKQEESNDEEIKGCTAATPKDPNLENCNHEDGEESSQAEKLSDEEELSGEEESVVFSSMRTEISSRTKG